MTQFAAMLAEGYGFADPAIVALRGTRDPRAVSRAYELTEHGDRTRMTIRSKFSSREQMQELSEMGMVEGLRSGIVGSRTHAGHEGVQLEEESRIQALQILKRA